jgi:hypothetical protein
VDVYHFTVQDELQSPILLTTSSEAVTDSEGFCLFHVSLYHIRQIDQIFFIDYLIFLLLRILPIQGGPGLGISPRQTMFTML